jgi:hypothetical protein
MELGRVFWICLHRLVFFNQTLWIFGRFFPPRLLPPPSAMVLTFPIGQGSFRDGRPLGISSTFNFMLILLAEHNILQHPFHMAGVFDRFLVLNHVRIVDDHVDHSRKRPKKRNESVHAGYKFGPEKKKRSTLLLPPHGYFGHSLIFQYAFFHNARVLYLFFPGSVARLSLALWLSTWNGFDLDQPFLLGRRHESVPILVHNGGPARLERVQPSLWRPRVEISCPVTPWCRLPVRA